MSPKLKHAEQVARGGANLMSKWNRVLLWSGVFVLVCFGYLWLFGYQTFFLLEARSIARRSPVAKSIPVELADQSVSTAPGKKLSYLGYEFEVPWQDIDEEKTRVFENRVAIGFHSGKVILMTVVPPTDFLNTLSKEANSYPLILKQIYGQEVLRSDYTAKKAVLETTPSKITLFSSRGDAAGLSMIVLLKVVISPVDDSAIFSVRSTAFQGFQFGEPSRRPKIITVELYSENGELELNIGQKDRGPTPAITQAEISRIIQTAHKASTPPTSGR